MAQHLRRAFADSRDVYVLNGLWLERDGEEAARIDHLLVQRWGMVIVESTSVHGHVRVNEHGEWARVHGSRQLPMPSPVEKAKRQADFLRRYLDLHAPRLAGKVLGIVQATFAALSVETLVAIDRDGVLDRPAKPPLPEVCAADEAAQKAAGLLDRQRRRGTGLLASARSLKGGRELSLAELDALLTFLPAHHRPVRSGGTQAPPPP